MIRLVFLHESGERLEFPLRSGRNRIGRAPDNDVIVDHPSVADYHCEIHAAPGSVSVRDLGLTSGTWIDALRIEEGKLGAGQTLQLGEVQLALEAATRVRVRAAAPAAAMTEAGAGIEASSGTTSDPWLHCPRCARWLEPGTAQKRRIEMTLVNFCPDCGSPCDAGPGTVKATTDAPGTTFRRGVTDAFAYAVRGNGLGLLLTGAFALTVTVYAAFLASFVPLLGLLALLILTIGVGGYLFAFVKHVLASSAHGDVQIPGWPELTSPADFASSFFQLLVLCLFCFGPWLVWIGLGPAEGWGWVSLVLLGLGAFYFPMALAGVAVADTIGGVNPLVLVPSIARIFGPYLVVCALMAGLFGVQLVGEWLMEIVPVPILPVFGMQFVSLYLLVVIGRVLGVMYHTHRDRLGWF